MTDKVPTNKAPTLDDLKLALEDLRVGRDLLAEHQATLKNAEAGFRAQHADLINTIRQTLDGVNALSDTVRVMAKAYYVATGEKSKSLTPGVSVVEETRAIIDREDRVMKWCEDHGMFLQFDERAFKSFVIGEFRAKRQLPSGVSVKVTQAARIATDIPRQDIPVPVSLEKVVNDPLCMCEHYESDHGNDVCLVKACACLQYVPGSRETHTDARQAAGSITDAPEGIFTQREP